MGDVVNLRRFRKARDRAEKAEGAARNRAAFGRTASEREAAAEERARRLQALDGHRLDPARPGGEGADDGPAG